jgi:hypothetical protein
VTSLPSPASPGKPKLGESNGDREYLMQVLRAATARVKLTSNTLDSIGVALRQRRSASRTPCNGRLTKELLIFCNSGHPPRQEEWHDSRTCRPDRKLAARWVRSYMPPEALWSLLAGAAAIPAGWAAARPQYTKPTTDIFLKSHFGGTSPAC